jgi:hypothetical protein
MRFSGYMVCPNKPFFESLHHTMCYFYHHQHLYTQLNLLHLLVMPYRNFGLKANADWLSSEIVDELATFADADHARCLCTRRSISPYFMVFWSLGLSSSNPSLLYILLPVRLKHCTRVPLKLSFYIHFYSPLGFHYLRHLQLMRTIQEPLS